MVKKPNGKWRICVDYTNLNKTCPKDSYPLLTIDQLIDVSYGHLMLCFMHIFSCYNQVLMAPEDQSKTAFITYRVVYAYKFMSFGLVKAGATYQSLMNTIYNSQLGRNIEVYFDDMIVTSFMAEIHLEDLKECFDNPRQSGMKLNTEKCTFNLVAGKFLGFLISNRGIEAKPDKIQVVLDMRPLHCQKDVQKLIDCLAALRRCLPFFDTLSGAKTTKAFTWTLECQSTFKALKNYLVSTPFSKALPKEPLSLYLSTGPKAVSTALIREEACL